LKLFLAEKGKKLLISTLIFPENTKSRESRNGPKDKIKPRNGPKDKIKPRNGPKDKIKPRNDSRNKIKD
jgi:hypothetical protein